MTASRLLENYLLNRQDTQCDRRNPEIGNNQDMQELEERKYDILICSDPTSQTSNINEMVRKWGALMKNGDICLVFPDADRERQELVKRLDVAELYVNEVGEEWFAPEFYQMHEIDRGMVLTVLTKGSPLSEL